MKKTGEEIMQIHGGRILRSSNRKDRHSKVYTSKGPKERRVRLAADTAIQFYDVQDRLGYDRPSKAVDWLIQKAKAAIDNLAELPPTRVLEPSPPLVENPSKLSTFEPQNFTSFPAHFMQSASVHNNELCLSLHTLENNLSTQIPSTLRNPISSGSSTTKFEENYPRVMSWNGDVDGNRSVQSRFEYGFNLQQDSMLGRNSVYSGGEPVKSSILPDFHTWDEQQLRTMSCSHFAPQGPSWGGL